jgi:TPR repeat protein
MACRASYILLLILFVSVSGSADDAVSDDSSIDDFYNSEAGRQFLQETIQKAEDGDPQSQYQLADQYWLGWGVDQDYNEAIKWYTKAANKGLADAQYVLANIYTKGQNVPQNQTEAIHWYTLAAEQGRADAQNALGFIYASGQGVKQDHDVSAGWYTLAAEQGHAEAQLMLGTMYVKGWGVEKTDVEAVKWFAKAAEQGNAEAQKNLAVMYANGDGVSQDLTKAIDWYTRAAEQGNAEAQFNLSVRYAKGQGVVEDYIQAYKWTLLAGMNGIDVAANKAWLRRNMTSEKIAAAQEQAKALSSELKTTDDQSPFETISPKAELKTGRDDSYTTPVSTPTDKFTSQNDGFAVQFPGNPQRRIIKDNDQTRVIHYYAETDGGEVKYNLFLHTNKTEKILVDKFQKAFLQNYLAGRNSMAGTKKMLKREFQFRDENAVMFKQVVSENDADIIHDGIHFFHNGDSISMICTHPSSNSPTLTFEDFLKSFEIISE